MPARPSTKRDIRGKEKKEKDQPKEKKEKKDVKMFKGAQLLELFEGHGILLQDEYSHKDYSQLPFDINDPRFTVENLFGDLSGGALIDEMYAWWGDGEHDIPWFTAENAPGTHRGTKAIS